MAVHHDYVYNNIKESENHQGIAKWCIEELTGAFAPAFKLDEIYILLNY